MPDPVTLPTPESIEATTSTEAIPNANPDPGAPPSVDTTPPAPAASDVAPANAPVPRVPMEWQPPRRSGLAGIIDEFRDAIAGSPGHQIYTDAQGNQYVGAAPESNRGKWMRVAANLAQGAAKGYTAGQGPGGQGRAFAAGFGNAQQQQDRQRQQTKELSAEARQENLDRFNTVMQQLQVTKTSFENTRLKMEMDQSMINFSQQQNDREEKMGHTDLGVYDDHFTLADVQKVLPTATKDWIDHKISIIPEVGTDGKQHGVHLWLRTTPLNKGIAPAGTSVWDFQPGAKPGEPGKMVEHHTTEPKNEDDIMQHNLTAFKQKSDYEVEQQAPALQAARIKSEEAGVKEKNANATKAYAEAAKANAEARAKNLEIEGQSPDMTDTEAVARMLYLGRIFPQQLNKRAKNYNAVIARADQMSIAETGQGYDLATAQARGQAYQKTIEDTLGTNGATSKKIASFDQFLAHARETSEIVNDARNTRMPWFNLPYNKISKLAGTQRSGPLIAYETSLETTRREYQNFLSAGHVVSVDEQKRMNAIMDDNASPWQVQQALKEYAKLAADRLRAIDFQFYRGTYGSGHVPNLLSAEGQDNLRALGTDPASIYTQTVPQRTIPAAGPNVTPTAGGPGAPPPAAVPANVQKALQGVGPGRHELTDAKGGKTYWDKNPDGSITPSSQPGIGRVP